MSDFFSRKSGAPTPTTSLVHSSSSSRVAGYFSIPSNVYAPMVYFWKARPCLDVQTNGTKCD